MRDAIVNKQSQFLDFGLRIQRGLRPPGSGRLYKQTQFPAMPGGRSRWAEMPVWTNKANFGSRPAGPGAKCVKQSQTWAGQGIWGDGAQGEPIVRNKPNWHACTGIGPASRVSKRELSRLGARSTLPAGAVAPNKPNSAGCRGLRRANRTERTQFRPSWPSRTPLFQYSIISIPCRECKTKPIRPRSTARAGRIPFHLL